MPLQETATFSITRGAVPMWSSQIAELQIPVGQVCLHLMMELMTGLGKSLKCSPVLSPKVTFASMLLSA